MAQFNKTRVARHRDDSESINPRIVKLAFQAAEQASLMSVMVQTYIALEKLITHDQEAANPTRQSSGLCSLMRGLNGEMERQVNALVDSTSALRACVTDEVGQG